MLVNIESLSVSANWFENYEFNSLQVRKRRMFHISKWKLAYAETETKFFPLKCRWEIHSVSSIISHFSLVFRIPHGNRTYLFSAWNIEIFFLDADTNATIDRETEMQFSHFFCRFSVLIVFMSTRYLLAGIYHHRISHKPRVSVAQNAGKCDSFISPFILFTHSTKCSNAFLECRCHSYCAIFVQNPCFPATKCHRATKIERFEYAIVRYEAHARIASKCDFHIKCKYVFQIALPAHKDSDKMKCNRDTMPSRDMKLQTALPLKYDSRQFS